MFDDQRPIVAPPGAEGPEVVYMMSEIGHLLGLLDVFSAARGVPADVAADAARLAQWARDVLSGRPVRVGVVGGDAGAAAAWVNRALASVGLPRASLPAGLSAAHADKPDIEVVFEDGRVASLEDLSPDPAPGLGARRAALTDRLRALEEDRRAARSTLHKASQRLLASAAGRKTAEEDLGVAREEVGGATRTALALKAELAAATAYLHACESTVPAVLRDESMGIVASILQAVLPVLYGGPHAAWRAAVESHGCTAVRRAEAQAALEETEAQLAVLRRRKVALKSEAVVLKADLTARRDRLGALDVVADAADAEVSEVRLTLQDLPDARRQSWAKLARGLVTDDAVVGLTLRGPDVRLPPGLQVRAGWVRDDVDAVLLLGGASPPSLPEQVPAVMLVAGGPDDLAAAAVAAALPLDRVWSVSVAVVDLEGLHVAASRASVRALGEALAQQGDRLDDAVLQSVLADRREADHAQRTLSALPDLAPEGWAEDRVAALGAPVLEEAARLMLEALSQEVPDRITAGLLAVSAALDTAQDAVGLRDASEGLAEALQGSVDGVSRHLGAQLAGAFAEVVQGHVATSLAPLCAALVAVGDPLGAPATLPLPPAVVPTVDVNPETGRLVGPLLRLRTVENLRSEALADLRTAAHQACVQLQARLMVARNALAAALTEALLQRLVEGRERFLVRARAAHQRADQTHPERARMWDQREADARALRAHARALGEAARHLQLR